MRLMEASMTRTLTAIFLAHALALAGCGDDEANDNPDGSADTDTDTDTDTDADTDTDTGFDFDTDYPYDLDAGLRCDGGIDVMQPSPDGVGEIPTGVESCPDGSLHRYTTVPCTNTIFVLDYECIEYDCGGCPSGQVCAKVEIDFGPECLCVKPCASDADCAPDEACYCYHTDVARCLKADCRTDADCSSYECGVSWTQCGYINRLACRSALDECHGEAQCTDLDAVDPYCAFNDYLMHWECHSGECD
jgi:hypothetical protein